MMARLSKRFRLTNNRTNSMLEIRSQRFGSKRSVHERRRRRQTARRTTTAAVILLVLMLLTGVIYVWYMGRHPARQVVKTITPSAAPSIKAPKVSPDAPVSIVQQTFSGSVPAGGNAGLSIKTNPGAACQITVKVNSAPLPDAGLVPKIADEFGMVDWSWTVPRNVLPGKWPTEVTCANDQKKSAYYRVELEVTR